VDGRRQRRLSSATLRRGHHTDNNTRGQTGPRVHTLEVNARQEDSPRKAYCRSRCRMRRRRDGDQRRQHSGHLRRVNTCRRCCRSSGCGCGCGRGCGVGSPPCTSMACTEQQDRVQGACRGRCHFGKHGGRAGNVLLKADDACGDCACVDEVRDACCGRNTTPATNSNNKNNHKHGHHGYACETVLRGR